MTRADKIKARLAVLSEKWVENEFYSIRAEIANAYADGDIDREHYFELNLTLKEIQ